MQGRRYKVLIYVSIVTNMEEQPVDQDADWDSGYESNITPLMVLIRWGGNYLSLRGWDRDPAPRSEELINTSACCWFNPQSLQNSSIPFRIWFVNLHTVQLGRIRLASYGINICLLQKHLQSSSLIPQSFRNLVISFIHVLLRVKIQ